ncbi:hypothetical protein VOLCADRAFT_94361 [Volvox carteri f. nagariensis]|uniref:SCP domain-containing protein n=1 Tax=Volvox carteri f. nagariensis TaxID=3068 RepID=D8U4K9_VOLCA|nr:uncharacterized protein VOLCADRAFT_94361 [Volvox carteri f. nagariensis]EFJ45208.1 hypothetical protein VOLCADRAFT_94361 [Volvox carteri f. nagariensis]|eukprot:XP_002953584.1 hypothetical protein VOLCADRAFT_94361 [Volvox carteri f. nagariensis]
MAERMGPSPHYSRKYSPRARAMDYLISAFTLRTEGSVPRRALQQTSAAYAQQSLDTHNYYRSRHQSTAPLRWSSTLEADAQAWANRCVFEHANNGATGQGENLAWGYSDAKSAIDAYYSEGAGYAYGVSQPADWYSVGHFTQVVWRSTTDLGCAVATCNGGQQFHVCRYYPPGNYVGEYAENVLPPIWH